MPYLTSRVYLPFLVFMALLFMAASHSQLQTAYAAGTAAHPTKAHHTYYVTADGLGDSCTAHHPCGSIQQAVDLASPGDRIIIGAGLFFENITIPAGKDGLTLRGAGREETVIQSAGGDLVPKEAPAGVPADIILDIFSAGVTVKDLTLRHPEGEPTKRDIGVFVRPPAVHTTLKGLVVERLRTGRNLEPTAPGSRGILVFRATGTLIKDNLLQGNYEDHIHLPTSETRVKDNEIVGATRLGIVVIQESETSLSEKNFIVDNTVIGSHSDGIQIQGDRNFIYDNELEGNGGYGIHLCGPGSNPLCVAPGQGAVAGHNIVKDNGFENNGLGDIVDNGENNIITD